MRKEVKHLGISAKAILMVMVVFGTLFSGCSERGRQDYRTIDFRECTIDDVSREYLESGFRRSWGRR